MLCTLVCWKHRKLNPINVSKFYSFFCILRINIPETCKDTTPMPIRFWP